MADGDLVGNSRNFVAYAKDIGDSVECLQTLNMIQDTNFDELWSEFASRPGIDPLLAYIITCWRLKSGLEGHLTLKIKEFKNKLKSSDIEYSIQRPPQRGHTRPRAEDTRPLIDTLIGSATLISLSRKGVLHGPQTTQPLPKPTSFACYLLLPGSLSAPRGGVELGILPSTPTSTSDGLRPPHHRPPHSRAASRLPASRSPARPRLAPGSPPPRRGRVAEAFPSVLSKGNRLQVRPTRLPRAPALHSHRAAAATSSLHSLHLGEPATASSSCANAFPRRAHRLRPRRRPLRGAHPLPAGGWSWASCPQLLPQPRMASGHLTIDLHTQGQPPGCLPLGPRLAPASPLARLRPAGGAWQKPFPQS